MISIYSITGIMALTATLFLVLLFTLLYIKKFETKLTLLFIFVLLSASIITLGIMMSYNAKIFTTGIFWNKIQHIGFALLLFFWIMFVNFFNIQAKKKWYFYITFFIILTNIILIIFTDLFITNRPYLFKGFIKIGKEGLLYTPFIIIYFSLIIIEYFIFIKNYIKYKFKSFLPIIIGIGILILTGFKDLLETFFDTGIPMLFEAGVCIMNFLFAYSLIMRFIKMHQELKRKKKLQNEIDIAMDIQKKILPPSNSIKFSNLEISAFTKPALEIGGDFYDFFKLDNDNIAFLIADVSGKSISAALYMTMSWCTIKVFASHLKSPKKTIQAANNFLYESSKDGMFTTSIYGVFNKKTKIITYVSAGHTYPIYYNAKKNTIKYLTHQNKPLGVINNINFSEKKISFKKNDLFFMYTDGITEATINKNEQFGENHLFNFINKNKKLSSLQITQRIIKRINQFYKSHEIYDDITVMTIKNI